MKTQLITTILLFFSINAFSQNFSGKAVYHSHQKSSIKIAGVSEAQAKKMEEEFKKMGHKIHILEFDSKESIFKQEDKLNLPNASNGLKIITNSSSDNVLYKNIAEKTYSAKENFMGKTFLIKDSLKMPKWELTDETKKIGAYTCYKATQTIVSDYKKYDVETDTYKDTTRVINTVAWYTPEIPVSNGPEEYWGLPGLILEVEVGKKKIVCSEITINKDKALTIEFSDKGKAISAKEFDEIKEEKTKEMMKRYKNNRKDDNKGGMSITITK